MGDDDFGVFVGVWVVMTSEPCFSDVRVAPFPLSDSFHSLFIRFVSVFQKGFLPNDLLLRSDFSLVKLCDFGSVRSAGDIVIKKVLSAFQNSFNHIGIVIVLLGSSIS